MKVFDFVAFDIETTGTNVEKDEIIEIGAVRFEKDKPVKEFSELIKPNRSIPEDATKVHGITDDMVADAPPLEEILDAFASFCGDRPLVAHNAKFDMKFLTAAYAAHGSRAPKGIVYDTFSMTKQVMTDLISFRLEQIVKHFNLEASGFHRAAQDAGYCGQVFIRLLRKISTKGVMPPAQNIINLSGGELRFPDIEPQPRQLGLF